MASHQTKNIVIKTGDIDIEIIPIIEWLNSFNFIVTLNCCEGSEEDDEGWDKENKGNINSCYQPYISFLTHSFILSNRCSLVKYSQYKKILSLLKKYGNFDKDCDKSTSKDERFHYYCFRFKSKPRMREFIKYELHTQANLLENHV